MFLSFLTTVMICHVDSVSAQQVFMGRAMIAGGGGGDESKQMKAALDREIKQIKAIQEQRMTTSIEDMKRVCELSDEQVTKLQVAAKGAIERSLESTRKQYIEMLKQFGMLNVVAADAVEEAAEESGETDGENAVAEQTDADDAEEEEELADGAWQMAGGMDLGFVRQNIELNGGKLATPELEKIWTNTVSKTLTEPQADKYAETVTARTARVRQAAVEAFVAKVDAELLLQDSQRDELVKLVNDKYGEALQKNMLRRDRRDFFVMDGSTSSKINKEVRDLFSDSQFHVWKSKFAGELEQITAMNGEQNGNNGGFWGMLFGN
jgi:hypothetical protein